MMRQGTERYCKQESRASTELALQICVSKRENYGEKLTGQQITAPGSEESGSGSRQVDLAGTCVRIHKWMQTSDLLSIHVNTDLFRANW